MKLVPLAPEFSVCRLPAAPDLAPQGAFFCLAQTDEEISLVCETRHVPAGATDAEHGWRALKIAGVLDFSMVGVIAALSAVLAEAGIPIFVVSTFNTDYLLVGARHFEGALAALEGKGYEVAAG